MKTLSKTALTRVREEATHHQEGRPSQGELLEAVPLTQVVGEDALELIPSPVVLGGLGEAVVVNKKIYHPCLAVYTWV